MALSNKVGVLAGLGRLPVAFAEEAARAGIEVAAVGLTPHVDPELAEHVRELRFVPVGRWQDVVDTLHDIGARELYLLGKIHKSLLFSGLEVDSRFQRLMASLEQRNDNRIIMAFVEDLEHEGFAIGEQSRLLSRLVGGVGVFSRRQPTEREWSDIALGYTMARGLARLDIGQACVTKGGVVLAVEALEGTDECIRRGARLGGEGVVAMKVAKPDQDPRFDVPTIGLGTLKVMAEVKAAVLAFQANVTFLLDKEQAVAFADANGLSLVGYPSQD